MSKNLGSNYAPRKTTFYNSRQLSLIRLSMKKTVSSISYKVFQRPDRPEPKGGGGGEGSGCMLPQANTCFPLF